MASAPDCLIEAAEALDEIRAALGLHPEADPSPVVECVRKVHAAWMHDGTILAQVEAATARRTKEVEGG